MSPPLCSIVRVVSQGLTFLPLRNWLSGGREEGSGTIFYLFAAISALGFFVLRRRLARA
jgi:hypothetical protein